MSRRAPFYRLIALAALAGAIIWLGFHRGLLAPQALQQKLAHFGRLAPALFALIYAAATVLFVPGSILTIAGGALFGPLWGTVLNLCGATMGAASAFLIARYVARDWVSRRAGRRVARLIDGVEEEGWRFVALVRLVPLFPFNLVNYAFGLTRIGLGEYMLASFICMAPGAIAYTYLGYAGREAASGQAGAVRKALLALGLLAVVAFIPRLVRRFRNQRFVDAATLRRRLAQGEAIVLLDVRGADEFEGRLGHIAQARNIPLAELASRLHELAELKQPIVTI